jgi:hypothetical protein
MTEEFRPTPAAAPTNDSPTTPAPPAATTPPPAPDAAVLARTSDIPVAGGKIFSTEKVVVTQPVAGQFKAFT